MGVSNSRATENVPMQERIAKEIQHGRFLAEHGAREIWNWESPAGKLRWARRVKMLSRHLRPGMSVLELGCGTGYFTLVEKTKRPYSETLFEKASRRFVSKPRGGGARLVVGTRPRASGAGGAEKRWAAGMWGRSGWCCGVGSFPVFSGGPWREGAK